MNGENFAQFISILGLVLVLLVLPLAFVNLLSQNKNDIAKVEFQERWGKMFEWMRTKSKWNYSYYLFFTLRRITFVALAVYIIYDLNSIQLMAVIYLNMFISIYQGLSKPFEVPVDNKIEYFYESCIWACTVLMMGYTDWVANH